MKIIFISLVTLLIFTSFIMRDKQPEYYPSKGEQLINSTLAKAAKLIQEKYNIRPSGVGVAMPGGPIQEVTLCFDTKCPNTKEQLRQLLLKTAQELLGQINNNNELQEFIKNPPFTIKNARIRFTSEALSGCLFPSVKLRCKLLRKLINTPALHGRIHSSSLSFNALGIWAGSLEL